MKGIITTCIMVTLVTGCKSSHISNGVIVHLFEWKYNDIAEECESFLAPQGYAAIQISPPTENVIVSGRPWWERYQPVSYHLTTRSGNEQELSNMVTRCNKVGIKVFVDAVINHMTGPSVDCRGTGGSTCNANELYYPAVPYSRQDFHHPQCGINDFNNNYQLWNCDLVGLHDLNQTRKNVQQNIVNYMNHLIDLGVAGFRIDAAKHMRPEDLEAIYNELKSLNTSHSFLPNTRPLIYQEVTEGGVKQDEYLSLGLVTDFKNGRELGRCFQGWNDLKWLNNFGEAWGLLPGNHSIVFIENHDTERHDQGPTANVLNYKKSRSYKMAISFMLAWKFSHPKVLSSFEFSNTDDGPPHDSDKKILSPQPILGNICSNKWVCQHRWRQIYNMVAFHNIAQGTDINSWWDNGKNQIAFCRGNKGFIAFNLENYFLNQTLQTCLPKGVYCDIISGNLKNDLCTGKNVVVAEDGTALITIGKFDTNSPDDGVLAIHIKASTKKLSEMQNKAK